MLMRERSGLLMVAEGAYKQASLVSGIKSYGKNLMGRKKQIQRLTQDGVNKVRDAETYAAVFGTELGEDPNHARGLKKIQLASSIANNVYKTRLITGAVAAPVLAGGAYLAARSPEKEKTAGLPLGLFTFMTNQMGQNQIKHGINMGIYGIRNMLKSKPSSSKPGAVKRFFDRHGNTANEVLDSDKWMAGHKIINDVSNLL